MQNINDIQVVEQQGVRVLTTAQLAECYECESKMISNNFANNKHRYEEGKHYICLQGADLQAFKNESENLGIVTRHGKSMTDLSKRISERRKHRPLYRISRRSCSL